MCVCVRVWHQHQHFSIVERGNTIISFLHLKSTMFTLCDIHHKRELVWEWGRVGWDELSENIISEWTHRVTCLFAYDKRKIHINIHHAFYILYLRMYWAHANERQTFASTNEWWNKWKLLFIICLYIHLYTVCECMLINCSANSFINAHTTLVVLVSLLCFVYYMYCVWLYEWMCI